MTTCARRRFMRIRSGAARQAMPAFKCYTSWGIVVVVVVTEFVQEVDSKKKEPERHRRLGNVADELRQALQKKSNRNRNRK